MCFLSCIYTLFFWIESFIMASEFWCDVCQLVCQFQIFMVPDTDALLQQGKIFPSDNKVHFDHLLNFTDFF